VTGPWDIRDGGVGALTIGEAIPAGMELDPTTYFATYVADGQPSEGFDLATPPLRAVIDGGPWVKFAANRELMEPPVDRFRDKAVTAAGKGATLRVLVIRSAELRTEAGVGVGSTLAQIEAAHGEPRVGAVPPTLGKDRCQVTVPGMPTVHFLFESCDAARDGAPATRIDVWRE